MLLDKGSSVSPPGRREDSILDSVRWTNKHTVVKEWEQGGEQREKTIRTLSIPVYHYLAEVELLGMRA